MAYPVFSQLSPNRDPGRQEGLGVLFHHSELAFQPTIELMLKPESKVSYHCLIDRDGTRCTLVPDDDVAWHAGASTFLGRSRCNDFLLGVAFAGDTRLDPLTAEQKASAVEWLESRWAVRGWDLSRMTDHRQVSPGRKDDLAPAQWEALRAAIGARFGPKPTPGL